MPTILLSTFPKFITSSCGKQPARLELPARLVPGLPTTKLANGTESRNSGRFPESAEVQAPFANLVIKFDVTKCLAVMLAFVRSITLLALALLALVVTDACCAAYLALAPDAVMLAYL